MKFVTRIATAIFLASLIFGVSAGESRGTGTDSNESLILEKYSNLLNDGNIYGALQHMKGKEMMSQTPHLYLAVGDLQSFTETTMSESLLVLDDDPLWLAADLAKRLGGGIPFLTKLDIACFSYDVAKKETCCPNSHDLKPPKLATRFLSEVFDMHTKLGVFFDEVGAFELSLLHFERAVALCGRETGLELRAALATRTVETGRKEMVAGRIELEDKVAQVRLMVWVS